MDNQVSPHTAGAGAIGVDKDQIEIMRQDTVDNGDIVALDLEKDRTTHGDAFFHRLGWKRLTIILIVQAIALGSLSLPKSFSTLGMVPGVLITVGFGAIAIFASYMVGLTKVKYPELRNYVDAGNLLFGRFGDWWFSFMLLGLQILSVGSHCITGTIAFVTMTDSDVCSLVFGVVSAILLLILAIPPSFAEIAILGYIDFASILSAIGITIISTGIISRDTEPATPWSAWPSDDLTVSEAFVAISTIMFAYAFAAPQFTFMDEMHTPTDFTKSISVFGIIQVSVYTLTGALIYAFVGGDVKSPALLSSSPLLAKIAFGVAIPVIYISGSINTTVAGRFIHGRIYKDSIARYVNTPKGWATWIITVSLITLLAWIIAEAIPFFNELLSLTGCIFVSAFSFYLPPVMWFRLLKEGAWHVKKNLPMAVANAFVFVIGIAVFIIGTYASVVEIDNKFKTGSISRPFPCSIES